MASSRVSDRHPAFEDDAGDPAQQRQQHVVAVADHEGERRGAFEDVGRAQPTDVSGNEWTEPMMVRLVVPPLGSPVVPDVKNTAARESGFTLTLSIWSLPEARDSS